MPENPSVLFLMGTRPEVIKVAPVVLALRAMRSRIKPVICLTGQHAHMAEQMLQHFRLKPDLYFQIPRTTGDLTSLLAGLASELSRVLRERRPDVIVVQGDTTSAMVGGIAGFYERIPVAHIEAGLRSHDLYHPFPEELNRRVISIAASIHFCPTAVSKKNLHQEGNSGPAVHIVGNTCIDALLWTIKKHRPVNIFRKGKRGILVTAHRRENWDLGIASLCEVLKRLADTFDDLDIVFAVHRNPIVSKIVNDILGDTHGIRLVEPMDYASFAWAMKTAHFIISDSGGVQEEALALGTPVLVVRDVTERPEVLKGGTVKLVGTKPAKLWKEASHLLEDSRYYKRTHQAHFPFGKGTAAQKIAKLLSDYARR